MCVFRLLCVVRVFANVRCAVNDVQNTKNGHHVLIRREKRATGVRVDGGGTLRAGQAESNRLSGADGSMDAQFAIGAGVTPRQAPNGLIPEWAALAQKDNGALWSSRRDALAARYDWEAPFDAGQQTCADASDVWSPSAGVTPSPASPSATPNTPPNTPPSTPQSSCWYRMPDCCDLTLSETTKPSEWFHMEEVLSDQSCDAVGKKLSWWCCRWANSTVPGTSRQPVKQWVSSQSNLPSVPVADTNSPQCQPTSAPTPEPTVSPSKAVEINDRCKNAGCHICKSVGCISVSLMWDNVENARNDLDLHVVDPAEEEIDYSHKRSNSGGELDVDMMAHPSKPVENCVFKSGAPAGTYKVNVRNYGAQHANTKPYTVCISIDTNPMKCQDLLMPGQEGYTQHVETFAYLVPTPPPTPKPLVPTPAPPTPAPPMVNQMKERCLAAGCHVCQSDGCISVTLMWDNEVGGGSDLDLRVTDPADEEIYRSHKQSQSGGIFDVDKHESADSPVENIVWKTSPPTGTYKVSIRNYNSHGQTNAKPFMVGIGMNARGYRIFEGTMPAASGSKVDHVTFVYPDARDVA